RGSSRPPTRRRSPLPGRRGAGRAGSARRRGNTRRYSASRSSAARRRLPGADRTAAWPRTWPGRASPASGEFYRVRENEMRRPITASAWLQQDLRGELPEAVRGEGIRIWDSEGREYIDACSGAISVASIGHGVTEVADAVGEQARALAYVHSTQFRHPRGKELAERIVRHAPGSLNH